MDAALSPAGNASNAYLEFTWNSPYSVVVQALIWIVVLILSLETVIGNAMVVLAYRIERSISKQVSNRYIVSLAVSDMIIGIEGFPLFTVYVLNGERWPLGSATCQTWLFLDYTLCLVSILTVLLITADRYLSVCHTAKYLKWQSPTKTQITIFASWIIPALVFGPMIYGWVYITGSSDSMTGTECSAPFLTNPYVNMGMYVSYYWTTLIAMLILYKGIHQAAKKLEQKAKSKERRHIALILSQQLGAQVGVSLMLKTSNSDPTKSDRQEAPMATITEDPRSEAGPRRKKSTCRKAPPTANELEAAVVKDAPSTPAPAPEPQRPAREPSASDRWVLSMKRHISRSRTKKEPVTVVRTHSSSSSDSSSIEDEAHKVERGSSRRPPKSPRGSRRNNKQSGSEKNGDRNGQNNSPRKASPNLLAVNNTDSPPRDGFLSASGVTRKISSISMMTRERMITSIFTPIAAIRGRRKRTKAERRAHKAFRTITFIVGFFALLWSPYYVLATVYGFCKGECIPGWIYTLSYYMCYLNSSGNPFAYALANRQFRQTLLRIVKGNFVRVQ